MDPLGLLSKNGSLGPVGAIVLMDFDWNTNLDKSMTAEEIKSLFDVKEGGQISARNHKVVFRKEFPRVMSANIGVDEAGNEDPGFKFTGFPNLERLAALARGDLPALLRCSDDSCAIARRAVMFHIQGVDLHIDPETINSDCNHGEEELEIARAALAGPRGRSA